MVIPNGYAQDNIYTIKAGDTLSQIVEQNTSPPPPLYGSNGRIKQILAINPQILNPNLIFVGDKIFLTKKKPNIPLSPKVLEVAAAQQKENPQKVKLPKKILVQELQELEDSWTLSADYGAKFFSYKQSGILGNAQIGTNLFNIYNLSTKYKIGDYFAHFKFNTFEVQYVASGNSNAKRINSFELTGGYKHLYGGIAMAETPLFKNAAGVVLLSKLSKINLMMGYFTSWKLPVRKKTQLSWDSSLSYALSGRSNNVDIKVSSMNSYSVSSSLKLSRELLNNKNYCVNLIWPIYGAYSNLKSNLGWGTSTGSVKSSSWEMGTQLGVEIKL